MGQLFQQGKMSFEMTEAKTDATTLATSHGLSSNDLAVLGIQEVIRYFWLGINELGLVSTLSVRARHISTNGRAWRRAVRALFPYHPFEVMLMHKIAKY